MTSELQQAAGDTQTRDRLIAVAVDLFRRYSYAGTSLQMIADELGFTKGAIYHHFRTREELLRAIVAPMIGQLEVIVSGAEKHRTAGARAEHMLAGYADHLAANRRLAAVLALDPGVLRVLRANPEWSRVISRQTVLLAAVNPGQAGRARATFAMAGMAAAADPRVANLDDDSLRQVLMDTGRRALGLRSPRRQPRD